MSRPYAVLEDLSSPVTTESGRKADSVSISRLTFGQAAPIFETDDSTERIAIFCDAACRTADEVAEKIKSETLEASDAAELVSALVELASPGPKPDFDGDGVSHPIVYTLKYPIRLAADQEVKQLEFKARTLGEVSGFLNAAGEVASFREFMRGFSTIIGVPLPITDSFVDALDLSDYATVKDHIMGKLTKSRGRLKRLS